MTTDRVYREAMSAVEAIAELKANSGTSLIPPWSKPSTVVVRERATAISAADEVRAVLASAPGPREIPAANTVAG